MHENDGQVDLFLEADTVSDEFEKALFPRLLGNVKLAAHQVGLDEQLIVRVRVERK